MIYTYKHQTADDYILQELKNAMKPSELIVVTSDRELAFKCKNLGSKIETAEAFLSRLYKLTSKENKKNSEIITKEKQDSKYNIHRLLAIFEKKLAEEK